MTGEDASPARGEAPPPAPGDEAVELTEEELGRWGRRLGEAATERGDGSGVFVALHGPLGAGKTTLVRAACRGAGVEGTVRSPTFTLHNHHRPTGRRPIHHVDLYRLDGPDDLDDLGWDDLLGARGAVFVEWAEKAGGRLPADRWEVRLGMAGDRGRRRVDPRRLGGAPPLPKPAGGGGARVPPDRRGDEGRAAAADRGEDGRESAEGDGAGGRRC